MSQRLKVTSIDEYLATVSPKVRDIMEEIRKTIKTAVPAAEETISYQIPAFKCCRTFIYFAAFKKHIGIYPPVRADKALENELLPYRGEKGNLKFPLDQPIPYRLIGRVAVTLAKEYERV
jgi:uncharacterized protein YdhG (YjbR/CyaY superfamily)